MFLVVMYVSIGHSPRKQGVEQRYCKRMKEQVMFLVCFWVTCV